MISMIMRFFVIVSIFSNLVFYGMAQTGGNGKFQIFAPNTYELAKYGDVPVDYSSGIPQINIPLITMVDKDISVDVSLSYHGGGIKVDQESTWVGLGWSLNSGGVITREVRGIADGFTSTGFFKSRTSIPDYQPSSGQTMAQYTSQNHSALSLAANNVTDNGADVFYFNFCGRSGKFFLDSDRNAIFTRYEDFKVLFEPVFTNGTLTGSRFKITDERGLQYEFNDTEITFSSAENYISAWYLSKITSPSGGSIVFEYEGGGLSAVQFQKRCFDEAYFSIDPANAQHFLPNQYVLPCVGSEGGTSGLIPKRITTFAGHSLEFVATSDRLDSEPSLFNNRLSTIILRGNSNDEIKRYNFSHGYFEANNSRKFPVTGPSDIRNFLNYRMRLEAVQEVSSTGILKAPYTFTYVGDDDPETDDLLTLPYRLSPSQDHWGYYNGSTNTTIFPTNGSNNAFHVDETYRSTLLGGVIGGWVPGFTYQITNGGNREPNEVAMKAGSLKRINYPTGGYAEFEFEGHNISIDNFWPIAGGLRIKQVELNSGYSPPIIKQYSYLDYMSSDKCLSLANRYYRWFWNSEANGPDAESKGRILEAFGVPSSLAYNNTFVVRGEGTSQLVLGAGTNAVYTRVKESIPGNGYTIYQYNFSIDGESGIGGGNSSEYDLFPGLFNSYYVDVYLFQEVLPLSSSSCIFPYPKFFNNDWRRGHLTFKEVYNNDGALLEKEEIRYLIEATAGVPGYVVTEWPSGGRYFYARYYNVAGIVKPVNEIRTVYSNGIALETVKDIDYSSPNHKQITATRQTVSNGEVVTTKYYYPYDYPNAFDALKSKNILLPIDTRSYKNNTLISGQQVSYTDAGLPAAFYQAETDMSDIAFSPSTPFTFSPRLEVAYNADNTLRSQSDITGSKEIFLWSYKGRHPVAKIENADYADVLAALNDPNEIFVNALREKAQPSTSDLTALNALRQHPSMTRAFITTYTYKPLVGMTSQADPRYRSIYYEYDSFGRLQGIRDNDNNIIKRYDYQYQEPGLGCNTTPNWQNTTTPTRCAQVNGVNTGYLEQEQLDMNPCSPTSGTTRWVQQALNCTTCTVPENWQPTGIVRCVKNIFNENTGEQEHEEINTNACGVSYRWVSDGPNTANCPVCNISICKGNNKRCINNVCELGIKIYTVSVQNPVTLVWTCTYHYEWAGGTIWSEDYTEQSDRECVLF